MPILPQISAKDFLHKTLNSALDFLFPPKCFLCELSLIGLDTKSICPYCLKKIQLIRPPICDICGIPFHFQYDVPGSKNYSCGTCRAKTYHFNKARSLGKYEGVFKDVLINYKYKGRIELLKDIMKNFYFTQINGCFSSESIDLILYVPLHKRKLRLRGFDQAYLIAKEISMLSNIPLTVDLLFKNKETKPQAGLKKQNRINNLKGTFTIKDGCSLEGKNILLVDDVFTTGVTVNECSKVLKKNGADRVEIFTLARAV